MPAREQTCMHVRDCVHPSIFVQFTYMHTYMRTHTRTCMYVVAEFVLHRRGLEHAVVLLAAVRLWSLDFRSLHLQPHCSAYLVRALRVEWMMGHVCLDGDIDMCACLHVFTQACACTLKWRNVRLYTNKYICYTSTLLHTANAGLVYGPCGSVCLRACAAVATAISSLLVTTTATSTAVSSPLLSPHTPRASPACPLACLPSLPSCS